MRKSIALGALLLVGFLGVALSAPSTDLSLPVPAITTMSDAGAAIGRGGGGGGGEGASPGVVDRAASILASEVASGFFILVALGLLVLLLQRNAGAAVAFLVAAFVIGAFVFASDQVETLFRSIYQYVL